ncbi:hypothetical protein BP5796_05380 [Coleophoma crateriformis]|uniref:F-box domain-containing protein n=1 Tax=Coleophoma crateriformis TaxID=565419 RepID=A0A3D8S310_9HELO|nr:hypothetical protein BP5796_05380 [Coleophoma crateriformis]
MTSSSYLAAKADALESQDPVSPSQARAAQIPLQSFHLPTFPPEAFDAGLQSLILTSDIKLDEYTTLLKTEKVEEESQKAFHVPDLPSSINALSLELFSLGYPAGFLTALGNTLPKLKSLTIYSQLFGGTTPASRDDALAFIDAQSSLQELHLLDVFAPSGFFTSFASAVDPSLRFLEINYTYRHSDPQFLDTVPSKELAGFVENCPQLVGLTLSISAPDITNDDDDREGTEIGVRLVEKEADVSLIRRALIENGPAHLFALDLTMFMLKPSEVGSVLEAQKDLRFLAFTVAIEACDGLAEVVGILGMGTRLEVIEIVGVPGRKLVEKLKQGKQLEFEEKQLKCLAKRCKGLRSLKCSLLRTKVVEYTREGEDGELVKSGVEA